MIYRQFSVLLMLRLTILAGLAFTAIWLLLQSSYPVTAVIASCVFILAAFELWTFITRTNHNLDRFLKAAKFADFSQRFPVEGGGSGFDELGQTLNQILEQMREKHAADSIELQKLHALVDHIPVPLLTLQSDGSIRLQNNAARRLFSSVAIKRLEDLKQFGESFYEAVANAAPGERQLVAFNQENIEYQLALDTTENVVVGEKSRLVSLQDIQAELDVAQVQAWQDLVRVLTHEIMNSITPITSLAGTAQDIAEEVVNKLDAEADSAKELRDLRDAVATVARRSEDLMQFVDSYRQLQRVAPPQRQNIEIASMFDSVQRLAAAEWPDSDNWLSLKVEPENLELFADQVLIEPVILNLLRNAFEATTETSDRLVELRASLDRRGSVLISVGDNGTGLDEETAAQVFVPFFTTKPEGTGVGLALAQQIMTAHRGFIRVSENETGGATFNLTF